MQMGESVKGLLQILLNEDSSNCVIQVSSQLNVEDLAELVMYIRDNFDIFTWSATNMSEISPELIIHKLDMDLAFRSMRQKKSSFASDKW